MAAAATVKTAVPTVTLAQLLKMPYAQRARVLPTLPTSEQGQYHAHISTQNTNYIRSTVPQWAIVPAMGGGLTQAFAAGAQLIFNVQSAADSFIEGYFIRFVGTLNPATGTAAAYAKNAGAPLNLIDNVQVTYGNVVQNYRPYVLRSLAMLSGQTMPPQPSTVLIGQSVASVSAYVNSGQPITVNTNNDWTLEVYVPLNIARRGDWHGYLPNAGGGETALSIAITCATSVAVGVDPELNILSAVSGTGHAVVVAGNFSVLARYRDGSNRHSPDPMPFDVFGESSMHFLRDQILSNITGGALYTGTIGIKSSMIPWILLTIIDGNQSTKFSAWTNVQILQESLDAVGNNKLWWLGTGSNMSINEYLVSQRDRELHQDLDEGIWPIVRGPIQGAVDADNMDGNTFLVTTSGGLPDWHYALQLGTVGGVAGIAPRVVSHVIAAGAPLRAA